ncbi:diaminopimelate epimerase [Desulfospira joergensenii]|uniref:diaminopimelate epimerase n=1 Tax=Desulfospira joergensenii TaxID=53329 RepID=UPI0003B74750|nr:diaminopimelate epimerase [Desulfospira joergensenii]
MKKAGNLNFFPKGVPFYKMHGCGNDFIIIDNRELGLGRDRMGKWARVLCRRGLGIHADGLFFLDRPPGTEQDLAYVWHFFNKDGSFGEMCGNAARCAAWLAHALGMAPAEHEFGTLAGRVRARVIQKDAHAGQVRISLPPPRDIGLNMALDIQGRSLEVHRVVVGVPHAVVFVEDTEEVDVCGLGRQIRIHGEFAPAGVNVNFAQVLDSKTIKIRTFERGVEDETFACGTGSASTQFLSRLLGHTDQEAVLLTRKGHRLIVDAGEESLSLQGPAELTFQGLFSPLRLGLE